MRTMMEGLRISVSIRIDPLPYSSGGFNLSEDFTVPKADFGTAAAILQQFHDLSETLRAAGNSNDDATKENSNR